ncbi:aspartyl protease-like protein [Aphelenchoides avenae]|nr:aspartyl protease-like protein [Aphelenchus avenae]
MQNVIPSYVVTVALMLEDVKTTYLHGGTMTYGGVDKKHCHPDVTYIQPSGNDPSFLPMDGVSFGTFQVTNANWTAQPGFDATALTGPSDVIDTFAKVAGAMKDHHNIYHIACNATVPSLFISIGGNSFIIPPEELLVRPFGATVPDCIFNVRGGQDFFSIGAVLAREYCLIFDYDNVRFGFSWNYYGFNKG